MTNCVVSVSCQAVPIVVSNDDIWSNRCAGSNCDSVSAFNLQISRGISSSVEFKQCAVFHLYEGA